MARRDRARIYYDILSAAKSELAEKDIARITPVQIRVNIPFDRFKKHLADLERMELVKVSEGIELTEKGLQYLEGYAKTIQFLIQMGIIKG